MSWNDDDVPEEAFLAQQEAILGSLESSQKRQRIVDDEEEAALLELALQESVRSHQQAQNKKSEKLARRLHLQEVEAADQELASALNVSEQQAQEEYEYEALSAAKVSQSQERHAGSWDCLSCTFTNAPFEPSCSACGANAPDHVLVFDPIPVIPFGLEIEILVQDGVRDGFTYESIAKSLSLLGEPAVQYAGYSHETTQHWKIVTDSSIQGLDGDLCFELVSPVLQGSEGMYQLRSIMDHVRRLGIATNASCGFHVHVDATPGSKVSCLKSVRTLKRVAQCFVALENAFDLIVGLSWDRDNDSNSASGRRANSNKYCRSNRLSFGSRSSAQRWECIEQVRNRADLVAWMNPNQDRYRKLNLTNLANRNRPSTCEFRHHGGVEDILEAEAWVRLILSFCQNAATTDNHAACLLSERATVADEMRALFDLVGCQGLEQFFVVERRLFDRNKLDNKWTCTVCQRVFQTSRSLSQHALATGH